MGWNWLMGNSHFSQHLRNPFVHLLIAEKYDWIISSQRRSMKISNLPLSRFTHDGTFQIYLHDWEDDDRFWRNLPRHLLIAYAAGCDVAIVVVDDCFERDWQSYWCCWKEEGRCCDC